MPISDYCVAIKFMESHYHIYILMSIRNGFKNFVAAFDSKNAANIAKGRCIINDDSAEYYILESATFDLYKLY